jgi:hypothetical protein
MYQSQNTIKQQYISRLIVGEKGKFVDEGFVEFLSNPRWPRWLPSLAFLRDATCLPARLLPADCWRWPSTRSGVRVSTNEQQTRVPRGTRGTGPPGWCGWEGEKTSTKNSVRGAKVVADDEGVKTTREWAAEESLAAQPPRPGLTNCHVRLPSRSPPPLAGHSSTRLPELPPMVAGKHGRHTAARSPLCILGCAGVETEWYNVFGTWWRDNVFAKKIPFSPARRTHLARYFVAYSK